MPRKLLDMYSENTLAKMLRVAKEGLENNNPPIAYPEFVPQRGENTGKYFLREKDFWTCGFFPGIIYSLLERSIKYPHVFPFLGHEKTTRPLDSSSLRRELEALCNAWIGPIHEMAFRKDTHDLGFILQPSLRKDWELRSNEASLRSLLTGARSLASRYGSGVRAIRSWDALNQKDITINSMTDDFLVIIDSMCNLDLLFYASKHLCDPSLAEIAVTHARTLMKSHLRTEHVAEKDSRSRNMRLYSNYHVVNFDPQTGVIKERRTAQGYSPDSTWARGQAWGILGYAQTYHWTKDKEFLSVACGLAEYFLWRLETAPQCVEVYRQGKSIGRYVPLWDFDAPIEDEGRPLRDSSAGVIAANGMLLLSQSMVALGDTLLAERYRTAAMKIVADILDYCQSREEATILVPEASGENAIQVKDVESGQRFDSILKNATANHNSQDHDRYSDHGLVYADYFLLEFGNHLLRMGFV
ncbi:Six-hairpin glycosidase-like protein [Talaromyces proteolyticus]|uniref:Six-hairpin glycosidase-like protein n=1 Tax=Talaromyces proteolyticus TaxID=1131652 RepID=A0AAD4KP38_9EURO|nr:Six-hairpin glycosidase-like protein [Talaromyces proteolyticus]KAH8692330.1 Six-hairpin glycosidase-like protein [Talaromyces proteolyticus]